MLSTVTWLYPDGPGGRPFRPVRDHQHRRHSAMRARIRSKKLGCGRVDPVRVLNDHERGEPLADQGESIDERLEGQFLQLLRRQLERLVTPQRVERQELRVDGGDGRNVFLVLRQQRLELVQSLLGGIVGRETRSSRQTLGHGIEGAVLMIGRTLQPG